MNVPGPRLLISFFASWKKRIEWAHLSCRKYTLVLPTKAITEAHTEQNTKKIVL